MWRSRSATRGEAFPARSLRYESRATGGVRSTTRPSSIASLECCSRVIQVVTGKVGAIVAVIHHGHDGHHSGVVVVLISTTMNRSPGNSSGEVSVAVKGLRQRECDNRKVWFALLLQSDKEWTSLMEHYCRKLSGSRSAVVMISANNMGKHTYRYVLSIAPLVASLAVKRGVNQFAL